MFGLCIPNNAITPNTIKLHIAHRVLLKFKFQHFSGSVLMVKMMMIVWTRQQPIENFVEVLFIGSCCIDVIQVAGFCDKMASELHLFWYGGILFLEKEK